ncbi:hypothetical protein JL721_6770 [Aureococcus anophagefferens]|nr:hypothetical protein JL721_6770 [Aureococcus anophagefferens]
MGGQQDKFAVAPDSTAVLSDHTPIFGCFEEGANGLSVEEACAHRDRIASYFVRRVVPNGASIFSHKNVEQEADEATGRMPTDVLAQGKTYLLVLSQDKYIKEMMAKRDSDVACGLFCDNLLNLTKDKVLAWLNKVVLKQGDRAERLHVILSGSLDVACKSDMRKTICLFIYFDTQELRARLEEMPEVMEKINAYIKNRLTGQLLAMNLSLFEAMRPASVALFTANLVVQTFNGETVFAKGSKGTDFYVLIQGSVEIAVDEDENVVLDKKGSYFGELALIREEPRAAAVKARASLDKELATENYECWDAIGAFRFAAETAADDKLAEQALAIYKNGSTRRPATR